MTVLRAVLLFLAFGGVLMAAVQGSSALSLEEKIPMLFMVADYGDEPLAIQEKAGKNLGEVTARVDRLVAEKKIGGILFKGRWTPAGLKERIRHLLSLSSMPLLLAQDLEWGLAMRHDGAVELPKALCMGAISDPVLLEAWGHAIARTAGSIGINLFLGPVADVNSNPKNPVIHDRSFGDNCNEVARRVCSVVRVIQNDGLASCVKHFPGHGNTSKDSHTHLPVIDATMIQLRSQELVPFKAAIDGGSTV